MCCLYGIKMTNMLCGNISIYDMYSATEYFDAVGLAKESMPQDALKDLIWCMYFSDDWDNTGWNSLLYSTKEAQKDGTAQHQKKHAQLEDTYNARWQAACVIFGHWVTADESRFTG